MYLDHYYILQNVCRVLKALPSARYRALGKVTICRVPTKRHSAKSRHLVKIGFAECHAGSTRHTASRVRRTRPPRPLPVTAVIVCRVPRSGHSAKTITCAARDRYPVATNVTPLRRPLPLSFAECQVGSLGKDLLMPSAIIVALGIQTLCRVSSLALGEITKKNSPT